jgi:hypothetical protein
MEAPFSTSEDLENAIARAPGTKSVNLNLKAKKVKWKKIVKKKKSRIQEPWRT